MAILPMAFDSYCTRQLVLETANGLNLETKSKTGLKLFFGPEICSKRPTLFLKFKTAFFHRPEKDLKPKPLNWGCANGQVKKGFNGAGHLGNARTANPKTGYVVFHYIILVPWRLLARSATFFNSVFVVLADVFQSAGVP